MWRMRVITESVYDHVDAKGLCELINKDYRGEEIPS
jgi:hypothetical protein